MGEHTNKKRRGRRIAVIALALLLALGIGLGLWHLLKDASPAPREAMRCEAEDFSLSQTEFSYYYWSELYYFKDVYADYLGTMFDPERPLSEQKYSETQSWQDYMTERAIMTVRETMAMVFEAQKAGYALSAQGEQSLAAVEQNFRDAAAAQSYASLDAYLAASFGAGASEETFFAYLKNAHLASDYAEHLKAQITPSDELVQAYYEGHRDAYADEDDPLAAAKRDFIDEEYRNVYLSVTERYAFTADYETIAAAIAAAEKTAERSAESVKK